MSMKEIIIEQGSNEWLELRKSHIGSSDASAIMGVSKWDTPYSLWRKKLELTPQQTENTSMTRGKTLEPFARERLSLKLGLTLLPKVFIRDFMIASLDGIDPENQVVVEIKHPNIKDHHEAMSGVVPKHYYPQIQHQMIVLDLKQIWYSSNHNIGSCDFIVKRDDKFCETMIELEKRFWDSLQNLECPELCEKDKNEMADLEWLDTFAQS